MSDRAGRGLSEFKSPLGHNRDPDLRERGRGFRHLPSINRFPGEQARDGLRCLVVQGWRHMAVGVQRDADVGVTEPLLHHLRVDLGLRRERGQVCRRSCSRIGGNPSPSTVSRNTRLTVGCAVRAPLFVLIRE